MGTHQEQFRGFARYNRDFNRQLYELIGGLSDDGRKKDMGAFFGSIHGTLNHILLADQVWLGRFSTAVPNQKSLTGVKPIQLSSLRQEVCATFEDLSVERRATDDLIIDWVEELTDDVLAGTMRYGNSRGDICEYPVWLVVAHLFNRQTHHRGQITTLLSQLGHDPGVTDYLVYAQE